MRDKEDKKREPYFYSWMSKKSKESRRHSFAHEEEASSWVKLTQGEIDKVWSQLVNDVEKEVLWNVQLGCYKSVAMSVNAALWKVKGLANDVGRNKHLLKLVNKVHKLARSCDSWQICQEPLTTYNKYEWESDFPDGGAGAIVHVFCTNVNNGAFGGRANNRYSCVSRRRYSLCAASIFLGGRTSAHENVTVDETTPKHQHFCGERQCVWSCPEAWWCRLRNTPLSCVCRQRFSQCPL